MIYLVLIRCLMDDVVMCWRRSAEQAIEVATILGNDVYAALDDVLWQSTSTPYSVAVMAVGHGWDSEIVWEQTIEEELTELEKLGGEQLPTPPTPPTPIHGRKGRISVSANSHPPLPYSDTLTPDPDPSLTDTPSPTGGTYGQ